MYSASNILAKTGCNRILPNTQSQYYRNIYLKSDHWKALRAEKLAINNCCEKCGHRYSLEVHHINYRGLYDVKLADLQTLCSKCHKQTHNQGEKRKKKQKTYPIKRFKKPKKLKKIRLRNKHRYLSEANKQKQRAWDKKYGHWLNYKSTNTYVSIHY